MAKLLKNIRINVSFSVEEVDFYAVYSVLKKFSNEQGDLPAFALPRNLYDELRPHFENIAMMTINMVEDSEDGG